MICCSFMLPRYRLGPGLFLRVLVNMYKLDYYADQLNFKILSAVTAYFYYSNITAVNYRAIETLTALLTRCLTTLVK